MSARKIKSSNLRRLSKRATIMLVLSCYIFGIFLGLTVVLGFPLVKHRSALLTMAESRGVYMLTNYTGYPYPTFGTEYYLYREDGDLVTSETLFLADEEQTALAELLPELFEKGQIYKIGRYRIGQFEEDSNTVFCIIAGRTVEGKTGLQFGSMIVRDLNDLDISLDTFVGIYTIIFVTALTLITSNWKQHDDLMKMQRDLVSNVSHELKTPITSIKAIAELLHDGMYEDDEELKHYTSSILQEADRLSGLVKEILELARLQSHRVEIKKAKCYADNVFNPVVDRYKMMCVDLGIDLDASTLKTEDIPPLYTDAKYIVKVTNTLLDNAVKFAGKGGRITFTKQLHPRHVTFCVSDNGPGIDAKDIDRIFERFYKADVTHNSEGSGLGLSIASETVQALGESIWVESTAGAGASFFFTVEYN